MQACFCTLESRTAYLQSLQCHVSAHGRPLTLTSDHHGIFTKHNAEDPAPAQFEQALDELNIESILAYLPQAKGSVDRAFQTQEDRLVNVLRMAKISAIEAANAWIPNA